MFQEDIGAGDRVEMTDGMGKACVSVVEDASEPGYITAAAPAGYGNSVILGKNTIYSAVFFTEKGMLRFLAEVADRGEDGGAGSVRLSLLSDGERIQRRSFFRFNCVMPFTFSAADAPGENCDGVMKDICGGGIRFVTNRDVPRDSIICCAITLRGETLKLSGEILHKQRFPKSAYAYQYRIQFGDLPRDERERILRYIYDEQRKIITRY